MFFFQDGSYLAELLLSKGYKVSEIFFFFDQSNFFVSCRVLPYIVFFSKGWGILDSNLRMFGQSSLHLNKVFGIFQLGANLGLKSPTVRSGTFHIMVFCWRFFVKFALICTQNTHPPNGLAVEQKNHRHITWVGFAPKTFPNLEQCLTNQSFKHCLFFLRRCMASSGDQALSTRGVFPISMGTLRRIRRKVLKPRKHRCNLFKYSRS